MDTTTAFTSTSTPLLSSSLSAELKHGIYSNKQSTTAKPVKSKETKGERYSRVPRLSDTRNSANGTIGK